jgi:long-chain acyl-CoA synthetase
LGPTPEFLITELALASHSIPSLTLSSSSLISPVVESHSPSAIIVQGSLLPHLLELISEVDEFGQHFVIVLGETDEGVISKVSKQVKVARWADIEAQGKAAPTITNPAPGNRRPSEPD